MNASIVCFGDSITHVRAFAEGDRWPTILGLEDYRKNLRELYRIAAARESRCAFIVNHLPARDMEKNLAPNGKTYSANFAPYNVAVRQVAEDLDAQTIDLPRILQEQQIDIHDLVSEDGAHLSVEGNHLYAGMVFERLKQIL